ncbi:hypothetical protein ABZ250_27990 [Streptomyces afghaniensis]|uniref:hypothetical protein n=1 Tax=Streptomyces afghaniensis TaxID=66865 RepID=UPI0033BEB8A6
MHHPKVRHVHMTGSAATQDAIVFGTGTEGTGRKKAGTPLLDKPATSELGGVSPTIVLPGGWSEADLRYQAEQIAPPRSSDHRSRPGGTRTSSDHGALRPRPRRAETPR